MQQEKTIMLVSCAGLTKDDLKHLAYQVGVMTTRACSHRVEIVDCIVASGLDDIYKTLSKMSKQGVKAHSLLIYSPMTICKTKIEFEKFLDTVADKYSLGVRWITETF